VVGQITLDEYRDFKIPERIDRIKVENRLFLPLDERWYQLFLKGEKEWEMRGINGGFNFKTVKEGRTVELRRGYQYDAIWGTISDVLIVKSIQEIPKSIYDKTIPPSVQENPEVIDFVQNYTKKYEKLILFRIQIKRDRE
jgi:hypothetical protein